ncbi:prealbumin-like fold domain-containing protein [Luteimonas kalidii]|uniref:DUF11 domain-containing protein n=1 Tax=Luteimonas kalidii TaxID=3042025 RepID=A0ABT6JUE5_9GAMM|nr:hypothetical protein [Luteimonas kalidii]MDH5833571.1 hypothetical protein [Luteimonas kalidii]
MAARAGRGWRAACVLAILLPWTTAALAQEADLAIAKDDGSTAYVPGTTVSYQIVVSNVAGPDDVVDALVEDPLPAGTVDADWTCTATGAAACGAPAGAGAISTTVDLPVGTQVEFTFNLVVPAERTGPLANTATVEPPAGTADGDPGNNTATDINLQAAAPTVQLSKTSEGGTGTFGYAMSNLSDATDSITTSASGVAAPSPQVSTVVDPATAVVVTETPATGFAVASATCTDDNAAGTGNPASFGTLAGNVLTISPENLLPDAQIVCSFVNQLQVDVSVDKVASAASARTGDIVTYTLTLANAGPGDATDVLLTDTPGTGQDCTSPGPDATCSASGGATCPGATVPVADLIGSGVTIPALPVGSQVVVTLECEITATAP